MQNTIKVLDEENSMQKIRLAGIDAPEKNQAFGQRSKQSLSELVFGKVVMVETKKRDRYGRHVGQILLDGQDVCLEQICRGMAWFYREYERELSVADRQGYDRAEAEARENQEVFGLSSAQYLLGSLGKRHPRSHLSEHYGRSSICVRNGNSWQQI